MSTLPGVFVAIAGGWTTIIIDRTVRWGTEARRHLRRRRNSHTRWYIIRGQVTGFDGDIQKQYEFVSEQLFNIVNEAIVVGANASFIKL